MPRPLAAALLLLAACRSPRAPSRGAAPAAPPEPAPPAVAFAERPFAHAPFAAVRVWAPSPATPGPFDTVVLLHGNQDGPSGASWLLTLRRSPAFRRRILLAPALPDGDYAWEAPATKRAVASLVARAAATWPMDPRATWVVGYSAGASRALAVAAALPGGVAGVAAVAGDALRTFRAPGASLGALLGTPTLLVCMTDDDGPNTRCPLNAANARELRRRGARDVTLVELPGDHALDLATLAPRLDAWMRGRRDDASVATP
ncbi:MAG: hypothetical protein U0324_14365 [Polyangiales bacterium]